jgi:hypothetical protein
MEISSRNFNVYSKSNIHHKLICQKQEVQTKEQFQSFEDLMTQFSISMNQQKTIFCIIQNQSVSLLTKDLKLLFLFEEFNQSKKENFHLFLTKW